MLPSRSYPPTRAFRSRNCSASIRPALKAERPYWTPTLSRDRRAKPVLGSCPNTFTRLSCQVQRAPPRFVTGSYRSDAGSDGSQPALSVTAPRALYPAFQVRLLMQCCQVPQPETAVFWSKLHDTAEVLNAFSSRAQSESGIPNVRRSAKLFRAAKPSIMPG